MKIRLSVNKLPWSTHLNIDPCPLIEQNMENQFEVFARDIRNLDSIVETSECTEILVEDGIDYVHTSVLIEVVENWLSKLRHNGTIILKGTNLETVVRKYINGQITTLDLNNILYGTQDHPWHYKSGCVNIEEVVEILQKAGLKIISKQIDNDQFVVIGRRP